MKLLVPGCAGFIGANFTNYILDRYPKDSIVGVDCLTYAANSEALESLCRNERFCFYKADICDSAAMDEIFVRERPEVVVNFAAESHVDRSIIDASVFVRTNVFGTQVLLDTARRYGVQRFHQVSTDEVYGDMPLDSEIKFTEDSPLRPSSPYSASKAAADLLVFSYQRTHGLPVSISRSTNNYGKYQHVEKLIPMTVERLLSGKSVPVHGDGKNMRDWLFVEDNCKAIDLIIREGKCEIYNVGADNLWRNIDLVRRIAELIGDPNSQITFVPDRKGNDRKYAVSIAKLSALGWKPKADFYIELKETLDWYKSNFV